MNMPNFSSPLRAPALAARWCCLLALCGGAQAQTATPADKPVPAQPAPKAESGKEGQQVGVQQVTVSGERVNDLEDRRQASAAKLVFGRAELDRNGDSSLTEVLKRLPGINIGGRPGGRGGEVRMRGMGGGFTQILINGERAPRGFALDSLSPDQVERIEIIRGTVAEHSTQAIAGTINIILREGFQQRDIQLKLSDNFAYGQHQPQISLAAPGKLGNLSYTLNLSVAQNRHQDSSVSRKFDLPAGQELEEEDQLRMQRSRTDVIHFAPRLAWRFENGDNLVLQSFMMHNQGREQGLSLLSHPQGRAPLPYAKADWSSESEFTMGRMFGTWTHKMAEGARLELKFGANSFFNESETPRQEYDSGGFLKQSLFDRTSTRERGANLGLKYSTPLGEGHMLTTGIEGEKSRRIQTRLALVNQLPDPFNNASDDDLEASSRRLAAFIQDEWEINKQWALNLGLRWESIRISSDRINSAQVNNSSSVLSPIVHAVWRLPGKERDQVRMSMTHSYRAPPLSNLIAQPALSRNNGATSPDRIGNPNLKPEQALGLELAFEHYMREGGLLSANLFNREIKQLLRRETVLIDTAGGQRWVSRPVNLGRATVRGLELEAKFRLPQIIENAPNIDLRANYSLYWSAVDDIPGPENRIDGQAKHSANLGLDYRIPGSGLTVGGSLNWTPANAIATSGEQVVSNNAKRQLDVYGLWKVNNYTQLRIAANNVLPRTYINGNVLREHGNLHWDENISPTETTWAVQLEFKL